MEYLSNILTNRICIEQKHIVSILHYLHDTHAQLAKYLISHHVLYLAISLDLVLN